jgi:hypothetical protein
MIGTNEPGPPAVVPNPVSPQEAIRHHINEQAKARANTDPLPGPIAEVFDERGFIEVEGLEVRPIVAYDFVIVKRLDLKLHQFILELAKPEGQREEINWEPEEQWLIAFIFTRPCKVVRELMRKGGRELILEKACEEICDKLSPFVIRDLCDAVLLQFGKCLITAVEYGESKDEKDKTKLFQDAGATQPMASAGG